MIPVLLLERLKQRKKNAVIILSSTFDVKEVEALVINYLDGESIEVNVFSESFKMWGGYSGDCHLVGALSADIKTVSTAVSCRKPYCIFNY